MGPIVERLNGESCCRSAEIAGGTIAWPDGVDIAPESLYEKIEKAARSACQEYDERVRRS
ncbi:MAG: DUF2442 domain-containing protein [Zetaproteobacteria bacterium]|nr:MAG: DUF2442 domain-containing protein [Zetaproteobacteria bacterium]